METISFLEPKTKVVELPSLEFVSNNPYSQPKFKPPVLFVYHHCSIEMMKTIVFVPEVESNSIITKKEHIYGKYDKVVFVDNDISDPF